MIHTSILSRVAVNSIGDGIYGRAHNASFNNHWGDAFLILEELQDTETFAADTEWWSYYLKDIKKYNGTPRFPPARDYVKRRPQKGWRKVGRAFRARNKKIKNESYRRRLSRTSLDQRLPLYSKRNYRYFRK